MIEVLVAMALVATTAAGLAELFVVAARATQRSRVDTLAVFAAESKMAELRGAIWSYDLSLDGAPQSSAALALSPAAALTSNVDGYIDYVDNAGLVAGAGLVPPSAAVYLRRWSVQPLPTDPTHTRVLQVVTAPVATPNAITAQLVAILTRVAR